MICLRLRAPLPVVSGPWSPALALGRSVARAGGALHELLRRRRRRARLLAPLPLGPLGLLTSLARGGGGVLRGQARCALNFACRARRVPRDRMRRPVGRGVVI